MDEQTNQSSSATAGGTSQSKRVAGTNITARQVLLEEARTAASQQLGQIDKLDAAAVRTVRIVFLLVGILVGGSRLSLLPDLGPFGFLGVWSLVASLFGSLYVYGTSRLFVGSGPADLGVEYEESSSVEEARVEVIRDYERGIRKNWRALYVNGFVLALSRSLLAAGVVFVLLGTTFSV